MNHTSDREERKITIRMAYERDWEEAMELAWRTFLIYDAKDYGKKGVDSFRDFISDQWLKKMFLKGEYQMMVALDHEKIVGIISVRCQTHISLLFVDEKYHNFGIGRNLIESMAHYLLAEIGAEYITVNAAPYAEEFYHKLGFWDLAPKTEKDGIIFTSMKKNLV